VHFVGRDALRTWVAEATDYAPLTRGIGRNLVDEQWLEDEVGLPFHLAFTIRSLAAEAPDVAPESLQSISFFSLCKGLFLPLSGLAADRATPMFGFQTDPAPDTAGREVLLAKFLSKDLGLSLVQKLSCILGDPFRGGPATLKRDSLVRLLLSVQLKTQRELLDRLTVVGDVSVLFAESRPALHADPPLTAAEVLETLRCMAKPGVSRTLKFDLLRSLLQRCGKLEAYFLAKLVLKKAGFGFDYEGPLLARALGERFGAPPDLVAHAIALTDAFHVAEVLAKDGTQGLVRIQIQPLVAVRPALASGTTEDLKAFPVWVERKYDGIRFMLHKSTDGRGSVLCGAYTRNRRDWLELVPGLDASIRALPAQNCIVDGELYGTVLDTEGARPASVYELYAVLQGERKAVNIRFAAFDLVYLNGRDLTQLPLHERRSWLQQLVGPMAQAQLPVPFVMAEGQLAPTKDDVNRLYAHFRSQGYEGIITKDLSTPYLLAQRDPTWRKRKPEITLDLVLLGAVFAVTEKKTAGKFGSYVIGARTADGGFADVGDVAGVDVQRDAQIQAEIMREGLLTGHRIERKSASGVRPGVDLRPHLVATVRFEGIVKEGVTGKDGGGELKLRDPKIVHLRSDKTAREADTVKAIEEEWLRQRMT
jgi:DNA ligase-1